MLKRSTVLAVACLVFGMVLVPPGRATPLAPNPNLDIQGQGLSIAEAGVGLQGLGNGTRNISITIGGPVEKAFLYWAGRMRSNCANGACFEPPNVEPFRDQELIFDGTAITGTVVGKEDDDQSNIGYKADVTSIVSAKGSGSYSIQDGNLAKNLDRLTGAGLFVLYTDPGDPNIYRVIVFEGLDFAFGRVVAATPFPENRVTDPVTFNYASTQSNRDAQLVIFAGDGEPGRPDRINISNNANQVNQLNASDGLEWDTDSFDINIPAGVGATTTQLFSTPANMSPDSLLWILGALRVPIPQIPSEVTTEVHDSGHNDITGTTVPEGTIVHDEATVSGAGPTPTGTVDFARFNNADCSGTPVAVESNVALVNGQAESSDFTAVAGGMAYKVHYGGDANYNESDGPCEPLTVAGKSEFCPPKGAPKELKVKPKALLFRYNGEDCTQSSNSQGTKATCTGDPNDDPSVFILAIESDKKATPAFFSGTVALNGTFSIDAANTGKTELKANTLVKIFDQQGGTLLQTLNIHTSCSQPLNAFDQFGSLVLEGFTPNK